jgi:LPXTG-motif cell wall-anchored protein
MLRSEEKRMRTLTRVLQSTAFLGFASLLLAQGSPVQRTTNLSISEPTEISGTVLQPGAYVIRVHDVTGGKVQVQVTDENQKKVIVTVTAMRTRRNLDTNQQQAEQTEFTYTTANGHPALSTWFYPGDEWGEQFATGNATWTEQAGTVAVSQTKTETRSTEVVRTSEPAPTPAAAPVARYTPPASETAETAPAPMARTMPSQLPKTASDLPLLGLIGLAALGGGVVLHLVRRSA